MVSALFNARVVVAEQSTPLSALFWWIIPLTALVGALLYVLWVTRFQDKYENQTERSVGKFKKFQDSFKQDSSKKSE